MRILILSRSTELYSTRSLFNAARRRKHFVRVIDHVNCNLLVSNDGNKLYYYGQLIEGCDAVIPRIGHTVTKQGEAVIRHFESIDVYTVLRAEALLRARDKLSCLQLLASKGVKVPKTVYISSPQDLDSMSELIEEFPKIIKLLSGTHGLGVIKTDDKSAMRATHELISGLKQKSIMQEFIAESSGMDIRALVVENRVVASMKRQAQEGEFRSNLHRGGYGEKIALTEEEEKTAIAAAKYMGLKVAGVDMLRSQEGPLVLEVNASPGLEGIETITKIDVATKIIQLIERKVMSINKG